jgi:cephalosporin-C deacetylase-like acetyl esterase
MLIRKKELFNKPSQMIKRLIYFVLMIAAFASLPNVYAQTSKDLSLRVVPQNGKYLYQTGETAVLDVHVEAPAAVASTASIRYSLSRNGVNTMMERMLDLDEGKGSIKVTMSHPGFLRCDISCVAGEDTLFAACGCGFSVEEIRPGGQLPDNFDRFWREARAELIRIPVDAKLEEVEAVDPGDAKRFKVSLANVDGSRVFGWYHLPEGNGPFPTVLSIPGSGVGRTGRYAGFTEAGIAVLAIEVHGLKPGKQEIIGAAQWIRPVTDETAYFAKLQNGLLAGYHSFGIEDPYRYYHRRTLQSAIRALDYLSTREDVDQEKIIVFGGSQGGGLSLLTAAIDKRVDAVVATVPGFCNNASRADSHIPHVARTMSYYDAALAASLIKVPSLIGVGFIDGVCRPTNVYSAYNNIKGQKKIENFYTMGHGSPPDWREKTINWIKENLR